MKDITERLDEMKARVMDPDFINPEHFTNGLNSWVFTYDPEDELVVRDYIRKMQGECKLISQNEVDVIGDINRKAPSLAVFDLYVIMMSYLEEEGFLNDCYDFELDDGLAEMSTAINQAMTTSDDYGYIVNYIRGNIKDNEIIFITGVGKAYPIIRSHKILNGLNLASVKNPVVLFYPGKYDCKELKLFNRVSDGNYYLANILVR